MIAAEVEQRTGKRPALVSWGICKRGGSPTNFDRAPVHHLRPKRWN